MSSDPYGFPESSSAYSSGGSASVAMWMGFAALMLTMVGPCTCYLGNLVALPVSIYAMWAGFRSTGDGDAGSRQMGLAGLLGGLTGFGFSALVVLFIALYVMILVFAGIAGASGY